MTLGEIGVIEDNLASRSTTNRQLPCYLELLAGVRQGFDDHQLRAFNRR